MSGSASHERHRQEMTFDAILTEQAGPLTRRLARMVGDRETAEDLRQETLARAWRRGPRDASPPVVRAWLHRTATNLALDELRRRKRREHVPLRETLAAAGGHDGQRDPLLADALASLTAHQRLVLLLRFEAGLSLREVGALLDLGEDAARKRVARARAAFLEAYRQAGDDDPRPTILLLLGREDPAPYEAWLRASGARVRTVAGGQAGLDLAGADGLVLGGSETDVHPSLYGEPVGPHVGATDLTRHLRDLAALRHALRSGLPVLGVCSGTQLLNVLHGGTLHQDLPAAGWDALDHRDEHPIATADDTLARRLIGGRPGVVSEHHQAVKRLGRGVRVTSVAPDGLVESLEVPDHPFALGVQWHPERCSGDVGRRMADALVAASAA
ncbi:MAG TPA: sigma-70 family RNA polymerase sigma factor [Baekduia sp.]|uniref:sigma-70 family RNA polymerase sigma factor n=1 Tax=Baekduia sp. TaxID=2600305 RepID=UPI002D797600|nr:sigma-70 family RNA polymerase sigma factor [Baekduia sp.]HET6509628.1 sigma-70 family RNA polymerase sigma factor [Baekduia sp.]